MACWKCNGEGMIVVCVDDMCRAIGNCIHGDGMDVCPECFGDDDEYPDDEFDDEDDQP